MTRDPQDAVRDPRRLAAVRRTGLLDTPPEEVFDRLTRLAARLVGAPVTFLSLVDAERDFYVSGHGLPEPLAAARELAGSTFCHHTVAAARPLVIPDTRADPLWREVPTVESLGVAAYLGIPLVTSDGHTVGSFCAVDVRARPWSADDVESLTELAASAMREIELRGVLREAGAAERRASGILESITDAFFAVDRDWRFTYVNGEAERLLQRGRAELMGRGLWDEFPEAVGSPFEREYRRAVEGGTTVEFEAFFPPLGAWFAVHAYPSDDGLAVYFQDSTARRRTEEALRKQSELTRTIAENATSALFMMDARGCCTYLNAAATAMTGYTLDEIRDVTLHDAVHHHHPDGTPYPREECPIDRALPENSDVRAHEDVFIRKNGEFFPVLCAAAPIFDGGVPVGTVVEVRDITEERAAAEELRESETRFRVLSDMVPQHIWITRADGYHEYYNRRWYEYTGTTPETARGGGWADVLHPDDLERTRVRWEHSLRTGEPYAIEYRFRRHDGVFRWFLGQALPLRGEGGEIVRWFGTLTDIQDQREAAAEREGLIVALDTERARLAEIFRDAPAAIAVSRGPEHRAISANPVYEAITGGRAVVGRTPRESFPELEGQGFFELLDRVYATGEPFRGNEVRAVYDRDGDGRPEEAFFNFVYQPLRGPGGVTEGIMTFAVDVTPQVRARAEVERKAEELARTARALEASNRELDQFAYVASHDLKAPLRGIANLSQWIEEDLGPDALSDESREHLALLRGRVHRMEGLIDGILAYSRAGRVREPAEAVDTGALVADVLELIAPPPGVEFAVAPDLPTVTAERIPLQQVFMNLLGNAVKHARGDAPRVEVSAREVGDFQEFAVRDNGPGIAPAFHERIFAIFQTLEARDRVEGTGIGLSLVRKIVESRGGRVWVESAEGEGATFRFLWPRETRGEPEP